MPSYELGTSSTRTEYPLEASNAAIERQGFSELLYRSPI
jgi:hypothetical protein